MASRSSRVVFDAHCQSVIGKYRVAGKPWARSVSQISEWHPFLAPFSVGMGPFLNFDSLLGLSPTFGRSKKSKCENSRNHFNHAVDRPIMHVVWYILYQEFASHLRRSAHRKNRFFRNFGVRHLCTVFSNICGTVVEENEKTQGDSGFWDPSAHSEVEGIEISVRVLCHKTAGFTTCCLSLWCRRCLWRVPWSRSCCDIIYTRVPFYTPIDRKNEIRMPGTQRKQGFAISGDPGPAGHPVQRLEAQNA